MLGATSPISARNIGIIHVLLLIMMLNLGSIIELWTISASYNRDSLFLSGVKQSSMSDVAAVILYEHSNISVAKE